MLEHLAVPPSVALLGPLRLTHAGTDLRLGGPKQRAVLALLALQAPSSVSTSRLVQDIWEEDAPATPRALQVYVSNLRSLLSPVPDIALHSEDRGYRLSVSAQTVDLDRFEQHAGTGRHAMQEGRTQEAVLQFRAALDIVRGPALEDLRDFTALAAAGARLDNAVLAVREDRFEAEIRAGHHRLAVEALEQLLQAHPYRERIAALLMWALHLDGRQAEAAQVYRSTRQRLVDDVGLEPGRELRQMHHDVLSHARPLAVRTADSGVATGALPPTPHRLVGRQAEMRELTTTLREPASRIVTVVGLGGSGKTRLAVQAARTVAPSFADGVRFIDLSAVHDAGEFGAALAVALDARPRLRETSRDAVRRWLASKELLLVIDTFEHLLPAARHLPRLLPASSRTTVLVTSRLPLQLRDEFELRLGPLPLPAQDAPTDELAASPAVELFLERSPAAIAPEDVTYVAAICRLVDGLPLGIELAAARTDVLTVRELLEQLDRDLGVLRNPWQDAPPRQRSLEHLLDWTHDLLPQAARDLLAVTGVFEGGFRFEDLAAVAGEDWTEPDLVEAAGVLVAAALVVHRPDGRYRSPETVSVYARRRLSEHRDRETIRRRHADHYLARISELAAAARTDRESDAAATVSRELGNLRQAIQHVRDNGERLRAVDALLCLLRYWRRQGQTELLGLAIDELVGQFDELPLDRRYRVAWWAGTWFAERDRDEAERWLEQATALGAQMDDPEPPLGMAFTQLAQVLLIGGRDERGLEAAERARTALRESGGIPFAFALFATGWAHACLKDLAAAAEVGRACLEAASGHGHWRCWPTLLLARVAFLGGRPEEALELAEEVLDIAEAEGDEPLRTAAMAHLGWATFVAGDAAASLEWWRATLRAAAGMERPFTIANSLQAVGGALADLGQPLTALRLWGAADRIQRTIGVVDAHENRAVYGELRAGVDAEYGERATTLRAAGAAMTIEQAVALALQGLD